MFMMDIDDGAPYDAIHVGAAVDRRDLPIALLRQLKIGGSMLIPVGPLAIGQNFIKVKILRNVTYV